MRNFSSYIFFLCIIFFCSGSSVKIRQERKQTMLFYDEFTNENIQSWKAASMA